MKNKIFLFFVFSIFFTVVIYFINYNFFLDTRKNIEINIAQEQIEQSCKKPILNSAQKEQIKKFFKDKKNYELKFYWYKEKNFLEFKKDISRILDSKIFKNKIDNLEIVVKKEKFDRRWNMRNKTINLYWLTKQNSKEYISVFIHELGHYIDLYFFDKQVFLDVSDKFYKISWEKTKIKKIWQKINDFVSGYAMTNKYEDFAETFNFYILHNKEFLKRTKNSKILKQKYDFFSDYLFKDKEFFASDFSVKAYKDYYWDITKIDFDLKKFLSSL